jgi:hypothetical protein
LISKGDAYLIERIEVDTFIKELGDNTGGMSRPVQVIGSNGKDYILKNQNVYNENTKTWEYWDCMFVQEILVYRIAKYFGISVPDCAIANVEDQFLLQAPSLRFSHRFVPGFHFASNLITGVENNLLDGYKNLIQLGKPHLKRTWNLFFNGITNKEDIPRIIILDLLTANFDRFGNTGNLIIASNEGKRKLFCIDHGHCFWGSSWNTMYKKDMMHKVSPAEIYMGEWVNSLFRTTGFASPMSGLGDVFRSLDQHIDISNPNDHCFNDIVLLVEKITVQMVDNWLIDIPDEWYIDKVNQISLYKHFLMEQKKLIRNMIVFMAKSGAFQSYLGGDLSWNARLTGTQ